MFSALTLALDQIRDRGLTECVIEDSSGSDRIAYTTGKPADVAAWLESAIAQLSGPLVVKAWADGVRSGGKPGDKTKNVVHRWRLYGTHGQAAPIIAGSVAPAAPVDHAGAVDAAVAAARAEWDLRAAQDELRRMRAEIDAIRAGHDEEEEEDEDEDEDEAEPVTITAQAESLIQLFRQLLGPQLPAPTAQPVTGAPDAGDITQDERNVLAAIRNAKAQHPDATNEYLTQLLAAYGPKN